MLKSGKSEIGKHWMRLKQLLKCCLLKYERLPNFLDVSRLPSSNNAALNFTPIPVLNVF